MVYGGFKSDISSTLIIKNTIAARKQQSNWSTVWLNFTLLQYSHQRKLSSLNTNVVINVAFHNIIFISVNPVDRNPLVLSAESLQSLNYLTECLVKVLVDDNKVNVLLVGSLQATAIFYSATQIIFLQNTQSVWG